MLHTGRRACRAASQVPVTFVAFDLFNLDGQDLIALSLVERRRLVDDLYLVGPARVTNSWHRDDGDNLFTVCAELGHEGVAAKRLDAPDLPGRRTRS
jgi:bifunctional non-homologous end joining protein LigD